MLPVMERSYKAAQLHLMSGVLGKVTGICAAARAGIVSPQQIREVLAPRAVPAAVADFVVRWASREFSLVAED